MSMLEQPPAPAPAAAPASAYAGVVRGVHIRNIAHSGRGKQLTPTEEEHLIRVCKQHIGHASVAGVPKRFWIQISDLFHAETGRSYSWQSCRRRMTDLEIKQQTRLFNASASVENSPAREACSRQASLDAADSVAEEASDLQQTTPMPLSREVSHNINKSSEQPWGWEREYVRFPRSVRDAINQASSSANSPHRPLATTRSRPYPHPRSRSRSPCAGAKRCYRCRSPVNDSPARGLIGKIQKTYNHNDAHDPDTSESDDAISLPDTPVKPIQRPLSATSAKRADQHGSNLAHRGRLSDDSNLGACDTMSEILKFHARLEMQDFCASIIYRPDEKEVLDDALAELLCTIEQATTRFRERIVGRRS